MRPKIDTVAEQSHMSYLSPGSKAHLRALEAFGSSMFKYAFSNILETLYL